MEKILKYCHSNECGKALSSTDFFSVFRNQLLVSSLNFSVLTSKRVKGKSLVPGFANCAG